MKTYSFFSATLLGEEPGPHIRAADKNVTLLDAAAARAHAEKLSREWKTAVIIADVEAQRFLDIICVQDIHK